MIKKKKFEENLEYDFSNHEVTDRVCVALLTFDEFILDNRTLQDDPELFELAKAAHEALFALYQAVGARMVKGFK